uniref:SET domain-containing protein n=1 Tax=Chromera velia CCMP2878 TaxID=1169474 RepID=A0A0G4GUK3_9ALVE|eukprot:Cvel_23458.t1-p1 / transcript=Cvel_23458.t1 / gene=Cvel_23458 / organism=Chromera_velia_CCMP2878 / gene_product=hypothetical protein / transcript_product=hypothetical protein / location=Cvel_scaffold2419:10931-15929(+) / protein_length=508 / sequence_SO=supercontig / SO=protein_coding / is_pseudo=false
MTLARLLSLFLWVHPPCRFPASSNTLQPSYPVAMLPHLPEPPEGYASSTTHERLGGPAVSIALQFFRDVVLGSLLAVGDARPKGFLSDPSTVEIRESLIVGAGDGLFATMYIPANTVVGAYPGPSYSPNVWHRWRTRGAGLPFLMKLRRMQRGRGDGHNTKQVPKDPLQYRRGWTSGGRQGRKQEEEPERNTEDEEEEDDEDECLQRFGVASDLLFPPTLRGVLDLLVFRLSGAIWMETGKGKEKGKGKGTDTEGDADTQTQTARPGFQKKEKEKEEKEEQRLEALREMTRKAIAYCWSARGSLSDEPGSVVIDPTDEQGNLPGGGRGDARYLLGLFKCSLALAKVNEPPAGTEPNVVISDERGMILFIAKRGIYANEELYINYGELYDRSHYYQSNTPGPASLDGEPREESEMSLRPDLSDESGPDEDTQQLLTGRGDSVSVEREFGRRNDTDIRSWSRTASPVPTTEEKLFEGDESHKRVLRKKGLEAGGLGGEEAESLQTQREPD